MWQIQTCEHLIAGENSAKIRADRYKGKLTANDKEMLKQAKDTSDALDEQGYVDKRML